MALSVDCGTYTLISCKRNEKNNIEYFKEINAFIEISLEDRFTFNIMSKSNDGKDRIPLIEDKTNKVAYACGEAAVKFAYALNNIELKRPMKDGCMNPKEKNAQKIMSNMIHGLIGDLHKDKEVLFYSVPANAVNQETNKEYHQAILQAIFNAYRDEKGYKVDAYPINEGLAVIYAELEKKAYTGIACSFGSGMVNVCYAIYGKEIFKFSIVNSGDFIDEKSAKATGESIAFINQEKKKLDLTVEPENMVMQAIKAHYEIMIDKTIAGIKKGLIENNAKVKNPDGKGVDIVLAGGTSLPKGFDLLFKKSLDNAKLPIEVANVIRPNDPLLSVAKGCLIAAENATE